MTTMTTVCVLKIKNYGTLWQVMARQKLWIDVKHGHAQLGFLEEEEEKEYRAHS